MTSLKYALILGLAALTAPVAQAATVDFHFGADTETGASAFGNAGDIWNAGDATNGGPVLLKDVTGAATSVSASWTSGDAWAATKPGVFSNLTSTTMDASTTWLMRSFLMSYSYSSIGNTNLSLTLTGLAHNQSYSLVLYAAGDQIHEGSAFLVVGSSVYAGSTTGTNRKISAGAGNAYVVIPVVSSSTGTLKVTGSKNGYAWAVLNGFQLIEGTTAPVPVIAATPAVTTAAATVSTTVKVTTPATPAVTTATTPIVTTPAVTPTTTPSTTSTATAAAASTALTPLIWGVNGHPSWSNYASWIPANVTTQMNDLNLLGTSYYRITFEGVTYPSYLDTPGPKAKAANITLLPVLPLSLVASSSAQVNYSTNYTIGFNWATYAISKGYNIPVWELGNEVENDDLVNIVYDGTHATDFPDHTPGGFVAIANGFNGSYQGIKDAYAAGRAANKTTITPEVLIGMCYRHWGLMTKIQQYDNGVLPCDAISWHWYGPNYGGFNTVINDTKSAANGRTPVQCLGDFKSKTDPTKPMDIWITETNRSQSISGGGLLNGSVASNATPTTSQDWPAEATAIQNNVESFKPVASVKAIFVYELYDDGGVDGSSLSLLASEGYFGLTTGLNGTKKDAFYTYQSEIKAGR